MERKNFNFISEKTYASKIEIDLGEFQKQFLPVKRSQLDLPDFNPSSSLDNLKEVEQYLANEKTSIEEIELKSFKNYFKGIGLNDLDKEELEYLEEQELPIKRFALLKIESYLIKVIQNYNFYNVTPAKIANIKASIAEGDINNDESDYSENYPIESSSLIRNYKF